MKHRVDRRTFLGALPALALAPRGFLQSGSSPIRVRGLSQMTLTVSDLKRSLDFYQRLFGMPIQARQGSTVLLRIGAGPQFLALKPAAANERPSISAFGMAVEDFNADRVVTALTAHGVAQAAGDAGSAVAPLTVRLTRRQGGASEVFVGDPSGIVFQLHDVTYCGGGGPLGAECRAVEPSPHAGVLAVRDMSHFTINVADAQQTTTFYQGLFGMPVQVSQGATPAYAVGPGVHFLMFTGGGAPRPAASGAPAPPAPAAAPAAQARGPRIDHACMSMENFKPDVVTKTLADFGITAQQATSRDPMKTYISMRMPNRGGAEGGTPELYFTDPDGLAIQLQDVKSCGGGGFLGDVCP